MSRNKVVTKTSVSPDVSKNILSQKEKDMIMEKEKATNDMNKDIDEQNQKINVYLKV